MDKNKKKTVINGFIASAHGPEQLDESDAQCSLTERYVIAIKQFHDRSGISHQECPELVYPRFLAYKSLFHSE